MDETTIWERLINSWVVWDHFGRILTSFVNGIDEELKKENEIIMLDTKIQVTT